MNCRVCGSDACLPYLSGAGRDYMLCPECGLVFVPDSSCVTIDKEIERYNLHKNAADNTAYRDYLAGFLQELKRIPIANPAVLDFGSGREAVLTDILRGNGCNCHAYDPLYGIGFEALNTVYDLVILCEVIEHIRDMAQALRIIDTVLDAQGYLLIKTELFQQETDFSTWWYAKDFTHINFLSIRTLHTVAGLLKRRVFYTNDKNIAIIH